jgi:hypothetical protein
MIPQHVPAMELSAMLTPITGIARTLRITRTSRTAHTTRRTRSRRTRTTPVFVAALVALLALTPGARAEVPAAPAAFKPAGAFINAYAPFQPGAVKVSAGREGNKPTLEIETHRAETRTFLLGSELVECAMIEEHEFVAGVLVDASLNFLGEDIDGNVWYFGEISTTFAAGGAVSTEGSWLVGGPTLTTDPADTVSVPAPFLYMPAHPEVGDVFQPEAMEPDDETVTILAVGVKVKTALGTFGSALRIREESVSDDESETSWIVPGLGIVRSKGKGESSRLRATSLLPEQG